MVTEVWILFKANLFVSGQSGKARGVIALPIEVLSRIFIAYFIYQLIQAFRKHGKKGG